MNDISVRAELARRQLTRIQRQPYEDTDGRWVIPNKDSDTIASAWRFIDWLERQAVE